MNPEPTPAPAVPAPQNAEDVVHHSEDVQPTSPGHDSHAPPESHTSSSADRQPFPRAASESHHTIPQISSADHPLPKTAFESHPTIIHSQENVSAPPAARSRDGHGRASSRYQHLASTIGGPSIRPRSTSGAIDWIVPSVEEKGNKRRTVGERLQPTIDDAEQERVKYYRKASLTSLALNIAIALQVFLGALTTGLAAAVKDARQAQVSTAILGGLSTMVASFLARARGSGEPEVSAGRVKDLDHFLRDCKAFQMDHGFEYATHGDRLDVRVEELRRSLEELLGNVTSGGDRKIVVAPGVASAQQTPVQPLAQPPTQVPRTVP